MTLPCKTWAALLMSTLIVAADPQSAGAADRQAGPDRPNVLWITCEDISPNLGCYGDRHAVTPTLDRLAEEGVRYSRAFASASVCTPARSSLITGVYASSLGTQHLRAAAPLAKAVRCFTEYLREAGYYCTNNVKEDYNFATPAAAWDESSRQAHWRGRKSGQPFFSVFNLENTHQSRIRYSQEQFARITARLTSNERHDPAEIPLPPYYPDTPVVRRDVARLYDLITAMDYQVADLLEQLEEDGLAEDTIVFFYSDHGTGMPRHKRWLYDSGTRVPLIIRFPEKHRRLAPGRPGSTADRLVSFVDFAPTMLSLVGLNIPGYMQGRPFLGRPFLDRPAAEPRKYVFSIRDRVDEVYEFSRTVREGRYRYIRNYMPHRPRMQHSDYSERTPTRQEFRRLAASGELEGPPKEFMSSTKAAEELYDTQNDPHEVHNLADSSEPEHEGVLKRMRGVLHRWMIATRDTALMPEADMHLRCGGRSPYDVARQTDEFPVARILAAADMVGKGPQKLAALTGLLHDSDSAVRFWAATGLTVLGPDARDSTDALLQALADSSPNVRFAAAEALCLLDREADALPVLISGLQEKDQRLRLHAAITLAAIGEKARAAISPMKKAAAAPPRGNHAVYVRWALVYALRNLDH